MSRILTVDWDFFFPIPYDNPGDFLNFYDWGHHEDNPFYQLPIIWQLRRDNFERYGSKIPLCVGWEYFPRRFVFSPGAKMYLMESHKLALLAMQDDLLQPVQEIISFDAHHDCGYDGRIARADENGQVRPSCEDWLGVAQDWYMPANVEVRYPNWKPLDAESKPTRPPNVLAHDTGESDWHHFDALILARSGTWTPPWCDFQWLNFLKLWPQNLEPVVLDKCVMRERMPWEQPETVIGGPR